MAQQRHAKGSRQGGRFKAGPVAAPPPGALPMSFDGVLADQIRTGSDRPQSEMLAGLNAAKHARWAGDAEARRRAMADSEAALAKENSLMDRWAPPDTDDYESRQHRLGVARSRQAIHDGDAAVDAARAALEEAEASGAGRRQRRAARKALESARKENYWVKMRNDPDFRRQDKERRRREESLHWGKWP